MKLMKLRVPCGPMGGSCLPEHDGAVALHYTAVLLATAQDAAGMAETVIPSRACWPHSLQCNCVWVVLMRLCAFQAAFLGGLGLARSELADMVIAHPRLMMVNLRAHLAGLRALGIQPGALGDALARHPQLQGFGAENQARTHAAEGTAGWDVSAGHVCSTAAGTWLYAKQDVHMLDSHKQQTNATGPCSRSLRSF